jgi:lipoate-protein ligase B
MDQEVTVLSIEEVEPSSELVEYVHQLEQWIIASLFMPAGC